MKIRFIQSLAGKGFCHDPGTEMEWPDEEAKRLIAGSIAVAVEDYPEVRVETATLSDEQRGKVKLSRYTRPRNAK